MPFRSPSFEAVREVRIGDVVMGRQPVKIISSVCASNAREMVEQASAIEASGADIIEWRADYFKESASWENAVRAMLGAVNKPVVFTFRSRSEGGVRQTPVSESEYARIVTSAVASGLFQAVDIEFNRLYAQNLIAAARQVALPCILSWHSFTPGEYDAQLGYFERVLKMHAMGPDVIKVVAMPAEGVDIARFIHEVARARSEAKIPEPLIAMCMGKTGALTRIGSVAFGSCATFASAAKASAPGQLDVATTRALLELFADEPETTQA